MSKKDYEKVARIIRENQDSTHAVALITNALADMFADDNPRFDAGRFYAACKGEDSTDSAGRKVRYSVEA